MNPSDLSNLLDIIRPYVSDDDFPTSLPPISEHKGQDIMEAYESTKVRLDLYKELIDDYLRNSKYINAIRNEFSESYLENYLTKVDIIDRKLQEQINKTDIDLMTQITSVELNETMIDKILSSLSKNIDILSAFIKTIQERNISLNNHIIAIQLKLLGIDPNMGVEICAKHPLQILGTDHDMSTKTMKFDMRKTDKDGLWINYRIPKSTSYCIYDLNKAIDIRLSEIKKMKGLDTNLINMTNSIRCTSITGSNSTTNNSIVDQGNNSSKSIAESYDGEHYRLVKSNVSSDVIAEILDAPNPVIDAYNRRVFESVKNNTCANVEVTNRGSMTKYINLKQYRGKSVDDICNMATTDIRVTDPEERLSNVLTALDIQKQVYSTRTHPDPVMIVRSNI